MNQRIRALCSAAPVLAIASIAIVSSVQTGCSMSTDEVVGEDNASLSAWNYYGYGGGYDYGGYEYGGYEYGGYEYGGYEYGGYEYGGQPGSRENGEASGEQGSSADDPGAPGSSGKSASGASAGVWVRGSGCSVGGGAAGASGVPLVLLGLALGRKRRR